MATAFAGIALESFLWSALAPDLAAMAGNCSFFICNSNDFSGNHADIAGGVIYSSNITTMQLTCATEAGLQTQGTDCTEWTSSGPSANTIGAQGISGYGPGLAFPPAGVMLGGSMNNSQHISYISDGSAKLAVPIINALDQAGNIVRLQSLRANSTVDLVSNLAGNTSLPQLPGQTQASADENGDIVIADLLLLAAPGVYSLLVGLPDFPLVS